MEPNGILQCVIQVWNSGISWMDDFISDDDSSSRCVVKHPIRFQMLKNFINKWPVDKNGKNVKCTGRLPTEINAVSTYHVDPSHRRRVYGSHLYKLEKKLSAMKKTDCECLIRNFGYAVKQNREKSFEEFETAMKAALEHHFDNHIFCNPSWCQFRDDSMRKSADIVRAKLRNVNANAANKTVYDEVKAIHDSFTTRENLLMLLHPFDSQKNEALNRGFAKQAPKNIVFSKTYSLFDRLAFVIIIDSVGYEAAIRRVLSDIFNQGNFDLDSVQLGWANREDTFKKYILERQQSKKEKIRRTAEKKMKLMVQRVENSEAKRKGDFYGRGLALQTKPSETIANGEPAAISTGIRGQRTIPTKCKCGQTDHLRISYWKCELNPKNIALQAKEEEEEAAKKNITENSQQNIAE